MVWLWLWFTRWSSSLWCSVQTPCKLGYYSGDSCDMCHKSLYKIGVHIPFTNRKRWQEAVSNSTIAGCCCHHYWLNHNTKKGKHRVPDNREARVPVCCHRLAECYPLGLYTSPDILRGTICVAFALEQLWQDGRKGSGRLWIISVQHRQGKMHLMSLGLYCGEAWSTEWYKGVSSHPVTGASSVGGRKTKKGVVGHRDRGAALQISFKGKSCLFPPRAILNTNYHVPLGTMQYTPFTVSIRKENLHFPKLTLLRTHRFQSTYHFSFLLALEYRQDLN